MRGFDVLDPNLPICRHTFLEASAGTGKTFAIEHLVIRFLLLEDLSLEKILIVTFTKAATFELRERIRGALERTLFYLDFPHLAPRYLSLLKEEKEVVQAKKKIKKALAHFEDAAIFTIHGFCFHTLQEQGLQGFLSMDQTEEKENESALKEAVRDFLRTELKSDLLSPFQLEKLLQFHHYDIEKLVAHLSKIASKRLLIEGGKPFQESLNAYKKEMERLKRLFSLTKQSVLEDLLVAAKGFSGLCDRQKNVKKSVYDSLEAFASQFDSENSIEIELAPLYFLPENKLKKELSSLKHHPSLLEEIQKTIIPLVKEFSDPLHMEALLAERVRLWIEKVIQEKGLVFFEDLIRIMKQKVEDPLFAKKVQDQYSLVLIDEFQDTDPEQWKIFSTLFLVENFKGYLYVIGDPKQSIYRFRSADLYTYLKAKTSFEETACWTLDTNFRSTPSLIKGLNYLLTHVEDCFPLPLLNKALSCPAVKPGKQEETKWEDGKKSLHVCMGKEEKDFYPFIAAEISNLNRFSEIALSQCAILVKDRYQAQRIQDYLKKHKIPSTTRRSRLLTDTCAYLVLKDLLLAVLFPHDKNLINRVVEGVLFKGHKWSILEVHKNFHHFHSLLCSEGILSFFTYLMEDFGLQTTIFTQEEGIELYEDLLQLVELLASESITHEKLLPSLEKWALENEENSQLKARQKTEDAVQILTIHLSKGLEFDSVFAIGLCLSTPFKREIFRDDERNCFTLDQEKLKLHVLESDAEKMRQFYVAITRAKKRLYLHVLEEKKEMDSLGGSSPMRLFLDKALKGSSIETYVNQIPEASFSKVGPFQTENREVSAEFLQCKKNTLVVQPPQVSFSFPSSNFCSYSSLVESKTEWEKEEKKKKENTLPSGAETGHLLHRIFEEIDFEWAFQLTAPKDFLEQVKRLLKETHLEGWEDEVCRIIYSALHSPFFDDEKTFTLSEVNPKQIWKEMEFLFPSENPQGFVKGFIDLFFAHKGKYYFLDWKSNDLGDTQEDYTTPFLEAEMLRHDYFLQASIYRSALERYLKLFSPSLIWGGAYYVFLRGLPKGIYHIK